MAQTRSKTPKVSATAAMELDGQRGEEEEVESPPPAGRGGTGKALQGRKQGVINKFTSAVRKVGRNLKRGNATVTTPRAGSKAAAQAAAPTGGKAAQAAAAPSGGRGRKRAAHGDEQENQAQNGEVQEQQPPAKRTRSSSATPAPAAAAPAPAARTAGGGSGCKPAAGKRGKAAAVQEEQPEAAEALQQQLEQQAAAVPAAAAARPHLARMQSEPSLMSIGPQPSQSLHESILKSPTPPRRATKKTQSTANVGALLAAAAGAPVPAAEAEAVDQPAPQQQQQQQQAVEPVAAQQPAGPAAAGEQQPERTGSTPLDPAAAQRQRTSPDTQQAAGAAAGGTSPQRRSPRKATPPDAAVEGGSPGASTAAPQPQAVVSAAAAAEVAAEAAAAAAQWWDPLDAEKVRAVKAALHISAYTRGAIPACREKQASCVGGWLGAGLEKRRGGSMYLSGLPGTGKSLTAHEVVRQCWRGGNPALAAIAAAGGEMAAAAAEAAAAQAAAPPLDPPPALISINCMSLTDPKQVVERILLGWQMACAAQHPESLLAAGEDSILYPAAAEGGAAGAARGGTAGIRRRSLEDDPLAALQRVVLAPMPPSSAAGAAGGTAGAEEKGAEEKPARARGRKGSKRKSGGGAAKRGAAKKGGGGGGAGGSRGMLVVVLDELDSLLVGKAGEELVEGLFALAHAPGSRLLLLGIANSIDLVQQLMRPGGSLHRLNLRPAHELFPAYQRQQFSQVLHQRLAPLPGPVFEPNSIELCSRKMANGNGDMRRALEACTLALKLCTDEAAEAAAEAAAQQAAQQVAQQPGKRGVGMRQMAAALSRVTGGIGINNDNVKAIKAMPPQQQLLMATIGKLLGNMMCSRGIPLRKPAPLPIPGSSRKAGGGTAAASHARAAFMSPTHSASSSRARGGLMSPTNSVNSRRSGGSVLSGGGMASGLPRSREVLQGQLQEAFAGLCRSVGLEGYAGEDFGTACDGLQDRGLIGLAPAKEHRWRRVTLRVPEDDIMLALADVRVLKNVVGA
ncbi:cell division control 6-like protein [Micractinium conductrix]|uniref:Cell division control 6-like protein n=1 Tax=Micractinium conductrix TaxID=554055 RepID=A0A2P6UZ75_9CHLO|nr:cell division control 6-like protein [Micractinium conductrix]|eukprot:PSC67141.1 cell division control 6-like protein [Micractinium conductrix]